MTAATSLKLSPAHEAQQLFFEIGMRAREVAGAELARDPPTLYTLRESGQVVAFARSRQQHSGPLRPHLAPV